MKKIFFILCTISVLFSNLQAQLLLEITRNFDCGPCKKVDPPFEHFLSQHPEYNSTTVFYHNGTPYPLDPFYLGNTADVDYRTKTFYKPPITGGNPSLYINGNFVSQSSEELNKWETVTQEIYEIERDKTHPAIELSNQDNGDGTYSVTLNISGATDEVRPYVIITESGIVQDNKQEYGVPESGVWDNIFRTMIPSSNGGDPFTLQGTKTLTYTFDPRGKSWNISKLRAIALLQNVALSPVGNGSRDIVAIKASSSGFFASGAVKPGKGHQSVIAYPNPFAESIAIPFTLQEPSHVFVRISDLLGRDVATLLNERVAEKESSVTFVPQSIPAGTYVASIYVNGSFAGSQKLIYNP
jgi:hypothetical protein